MKVQITVLNKTFGECLAIS